jgi:hypothetical protein
LKNGGKFWKCGRSTSRLTKLLAAELEKDRAKIAGLSRDDLVAHLRDELRDVIQMKVENPFFNVAYVRHLLLANPTRTLSLDLDPRTLHMAIAQCINKGIKLPRACTLRLAKGVAEPKSLHRKKGKTHDFLHHEIWRLCLVLKEYRQMQLGSGESKPTRSSSVDTAFGLIAEAAKGLRATTNLSEGQVRDIYYERETAYREIN